MSDEAVRLFGVTAVLVFNTVTHLEGERIPRVLSCDTLIGRQGCLRERLVICRSTTIPNLEMRLLKEAQSFSIELVDRLGGSVHIFIILVAHESRSTVR